jgi:zinc D-Ala-D-Ala dipeptidase
MSIDMKKLIMCIFIISSHHYVSSKSWQHIMLGNRLLLDNTCFNIIHNQYKLFRAQISPTIVHQSIKSIPIVDNNEPLVDIRNMPNKRITMLPNSPENKPFHDAVYNSGLPAASKMRKELYHRLEHMIIYLDELAHAFGYKPGEISIMVFEGLRDLQTQKNLFQNKLEEIKRTHPELSNTDAEIETAKWVSPTKNNIPVHSTGAAVDIRLWSSVTESFIDLGKFGVIWGENKNAPTFAEDITDAQKLNRLYVLMAAAKAGLVNYAYEFWHFSYGDRYAAYWQVKDVSQRVARYGAVE